MTKSANCTALLTQCSPGARSNRDRLDNGKPRPLTKIPGNLHTVRAGGMPLVAISGEIDLKNGWAQLATARYASESVSGEAHPRRPRARDAETLTVLTTLSEVRTA